MQAYLHDGWVVPRTNQIPRITPDKVRKGVFVSLLHSFSQFRSEVLRTGIFIAVCSLSVYGF